MPVAPQVTYPGVYIQEVPSDVRTVVPVDTATTGFIGRARRGPVDEAVVLHGFADFEKIFGGLWVMSSLGYAVRDFFLNGGSKAVVVRLFHAEARAARKPSGSKKNENEDGEAAKGPAATKASISVPGKSGNLGLEAKYPGAWGNHLRAEVSVIEDDSMRGEVAERYGLTKDDRGDFFDLTIEDPSTGTREVFRNLTVREGGPRRVDEVLSDSELVVVTEVPSAPPPASEAPVAVKEPATDGGELDSKDILGNEDQKTGLYALEGADIFNLLCIPPYNQGDVEVPVLEAAAKYCEKRRAILLVDPPASWGKKEAKDYRKALSLTGNNTAFFFPRVQKANPLRDNRIEEFPPSASVAGVIARTDATRGVWKAPAGLDATISGLAGLAVTLTDAENGELNPLGVNCLRTLPGAGHVVWGARTIDGDDRLASQWKYLPVRRTALFIEESLYRGTQWAVFEPNDEPLWSQLRLNIGAFMHGLFRQGAFQGASPKDAYFVKCDQNTTPQADVDRGIVNVVVGFAPLKPAEFVVLYIQQITANSAA
jgi:phage tail sheath protein FI